MILLHNFYNIVDQYFDDPNSLFSVKSLIYSDHADKYTKSLYVDERIKKHIIENFNRKLKISITIRTVDIDINIVYSEGENLDKYKTQIITTVVCFMHFVCVHFKCDIPRPLSIHVFLTDYKKEFPSESTLLTPFNVNTGVTINGKTILVYRKEEVIKVLIHELIHFFGIDHMHVSQDKEHELQHLFSLQNRVYLTESYTDFLACTSNTMLYSVLSSTGKLLSFKSFIRSFNSNLKRERLYILEQASRVLHHQNYCYGVKHNYSEKTHVIAYYIIKAVMFSNWKKYIEMYNEHMTKNHSLFQDEIVKDCENYKIFCNMRVKPSDTLRMTSLDVLNKMKTI
jgi:hypothetical protein|uniref:Uncharacterized protein n=1 Tax=viral metagenome TaxID=1070528 RepID=A0A6C0BEZ3_9ZZZZ